MYIYIPRFWRRPGVHLGRLFTRFYRLERHSGALLLTMAFLSIVWANIPALHYEGFWNYRLGLPLHKWLSDGLMTLFFLMVGLEIKRELMHGELASWRRAALPIMAAVGGALVPACLYIFIHAGFITVSGWGIPMATDIAFSLGLMSLLGGKIPGSMRVFLATLAITDDVLAILVIAVFYANHIHWSWALSAILLCVCLWLVRRGLPQWGFIVCGLLLWVLLEKSGIHTVMSGVLLAAILPLSYSDGRALGDRWLAVLQPWVTFGVVPLFALANAGVVFGSDWVAHLTSGVSLAIMIGLVLGKQIGIIGVAWLAVHFHFAVFARGFGWRHLYVLSWLAGIGFTASLFVAGLAFERTDHFVEAKLGILAASSIAAVGGLVAGKILVPGKDE